MKFENLNYLIIVLYLYYKLKCTLCLENDHISYCLKSLNASVTPFNELALVTI